MIRQPPSAGVATQISPDVANDPVYRGFAALALYARDLAEKLEREERCPSGLAAFFPIALLLNALTRRRRRRARTWADALGAFIAADPLTRHDTGEVSTPDAATIIAESPLTHAAPCPAPASSQPRPAGRLPRRPPNPHRATPPRATATRGHTTGPRLLAPRAVSHRLLARPPRRTAGAKTLPPPRASPSAATA